MKNKKWCVHVYVLHTISGISHCDNVSAAKEEGVKRYLAEGKKRFVDNISDIEVMRECECGMDNDTDNKRCEGCGAKL